MHTQDAANERTWVRNIQAARELFTNSPQLAERIRELERGQDDVEGKFDEREALKKRHVGPREQIRKEWPFQELRKLFTERGAQRSGGALPSVEGVTEEM